MNGYNVIKAASPAVLCVCGIQKFNNSSNYRLSTFVIIEKFDNVFLYHSCLTGELVAVTNFFLAKQYLIEHWFLVKDDIDEISMIPRIRKLLTCLGKKRKLGYKTIEIITTTHCNAKCYYCYEDNFKKMTMRENTAKHVVDFITKHRYDNAIHIKWYGGEPLLNTSVIDIISEGLTRNGVSLTSSMISNGYLFNDKITCKAKNEWRLSNVRITIDGTEKTYNQTKCFTNCSCSAFQKVVNNIDGILKAGISTTIRVNIEENNLEDVSRLLEFIYAKYQKERLLDVMLRPLNNTESNKSIESRGKGRDFILRKITLLKNQLFENGIDVNCGKLSGMSTSTCIADSGKYVVIKPNGELAYCSADFDRKKFGTIYNSFQEIAYPQLSNNLYEKGEICYDCPLFPLCTPSKLCPSCLKPICNVAQKEYNINDVRLTMRKAYRQSLSNNIK